jgi:predicted nucleic acid-binding protein
MSGIAIDSNVALYAFIDDPRSFVAERIIADGPIISVQLLNEFSNVARRKLGFDWTKIASAIHDLLRLCPRVVILTPTLHHDARRLAERYKLSIYDALMIAAALEGRCDTLLSEDMQHGLVIEKRLTIRNPFI